MNIGVHVCLLIQFCPDICPLEGWLDHMVVLFSAFRRTCTLFPVVAVQTYISTDSVG